MDPRPGPDTRHFEQAQTSRVSRETPAGDSARRVDASRPFFAHLRMGWWRVIAVVLVLLVTLFAMQNLPGLIVALVLIATEGPQVLDDPAQLAGRPVMVLSANLALGLLIPAALLVMRWIGGVPWRAALASGRTFSWRRLFILVPVMALVFTVAVLATAVLVPGSYGAFTITGGVVVLVVITLLTMPLASSAEEVIFRGGVGPAVGSWFRGERTAVVAGLIASTLLFGVMHFSGDPWIIAYQLWFGLVVGLMAITTRGIEASIAFHVTHNVVLFVSAAVASGGDGIVIDRTAGESDTTMIVMLALVPFHLVLLGVVHLMERRRRTAQGRAATGS